MANKYELMAGRIEAVLGTQKVPARVWQATVSHRYVRFDLTIPLGVRISKMTQLQEELAFSLGAPAVTVYRDGGVLHIEVPKDGPPVDYTLATAFGQVTTMPPCTALLGERTDSTPLLLKVDSPDIAHLLISGTTGSGKTVLLKTILLTLAMTNHPGSLQMVLIDPKGSKLAPLAAYPHAWQGLDVIADPDDAALVLKALVVEMRRRSKVKSALPRIIVAIDELAELIGAGGAAITDPLQSLTQAGREPGLHVVAATQRPSATLVGGMVKANFPARLIGSVVSTEDAKVAAGIGGTGAERLGGRGDFLLVAKGQQIRFQAVNTSDEHIRAIGAAIWHNGRRSRAWTQFQVEQVLAQGSAVTIPQREPVTLPAALAGLVDVEVGVGGWVVGGSAEAANATGSDSRTVPPFPPTHQPPHSTRRRVPVAQRYTPAQLYDAFLASDRNRKAACTALFGYSDTTTLTVLDQAIRQLDAPAPEEPADDRP